MKEVHFKKVLCPTDFSDFSYHALDYAISMAGQYKDSELHVVHVLKLGSMVSPVFNLSEFETPDINLEAIALKASEERLEECLNRIPKHINTKLKVLKGARSHESINKYSLENEISLIVIATHGHSGVKHAIFGSTTERLIKSSSCPVLSVNPLPLKGKK